MKAIEEWKLAISESEAHARLAKRKISPSLIEKVLSGRYKSELNQLYSSIFKEEMAKDGFVLTDEAS